MFKKTLRGFLMLGVVIGLGSLSPSQAQAKTLFGDYLKDKGIEVTTSGAMDFYSKYIWRGIRLDNDPVLQPSFTVSVNGFSANAWGSYDLGGDDNLSSNETDTTLSYAHTFENLTVGNVALSPVTITGGNIYYDFPGTNTYTSELFAGVTYGSFLSPSVTYYYDYIDESKGGGDGNYVVLALAHSIPLVKDYGITMDLSSHVGFNSGDYIRGEGGDYLLKAGLTIPLTGNLKFVPSVNYSIPFGDLKSKDDGNQKQYVYGGAGLSLTF
jgi:hypothetical protein